MTHLIINSYGPSIFGKFIHLPSQALCYMKDNGVSYDSIYIQDTGGLHSSNEGLDWIATDAKYLKRKMERIRSKNTKFNGLDVVLNQKKPISNFIICPSSFSYEPTREVLLDDYELFKNYIKLNPKLISLVKRYNDRLGLSTSNSLGVQIRTTDINHWHREAGIVSFDDTVRAVKEELDKGEYDVLFVASDNIRDSITFRYLFEGIIDVKTVLEISQFFIADKSPDNLHYYNFTKENYTYKNANFWLFTYLEFCLLSLCNKKILRHNSCNWRVLACLSNLLSFDIPHPDNNEFIEIKYNTNTVLTKQK